MSPLFEAVRDEAPPAVMLVRPAAVRRQPAWLRALVAPSPMLRWCGVAASVYQQLDRQ